jgi:hypothetical protein
MNVKKRSYSKSIGSPPLGAGRSKPRNHKGEKERRRVVGPRLGAEEVFEEETGEAAGVVADDGVLLKEVVEEHAEAELLEG